MLFSYFYTQNLYIQVFNPLTRRHLNKSLLDIQEFNGFGRVEKYFCISTITQNFLKFSKESAGLLDSVNSVKVLHITARPFVYDQDPLEYYVLHIFQ